MVRPVVCIDDPPRLKFAGFFFSPMYSVDLVASSRNNNNKKRKMNLLKPILRFEFHENAATTILEPA